MVMLDYKNLLVLVDNSDLDGVLLRYIRHHLNDQVSTKITLMYFLPSAGDKSILDYLKDKDQNVDLEQIYAKRRAKIFDEVKSRYENAMDSWRKVEVDILIKEDNSKEAILRDVKQLAPDLVVLGKKDLSKGSGKIVKLITRNLPIDTIVIPQETLHFSNVNPIGFAIDFSDTASYLLQRIYNLKEYKPGLKFRGIHVLNMVPIDYTMYNVHREILENQVKELDEKFDELLTQFDLVDKDVTIQFETNLEHSLIQKIYEIALKKEVSMIMVAPKKHTAVGRFLLGSVTEGLFEISSKMPIYIIH